MKGNGKVFFKGMFLLLCIVMVPVSTVFAQPCEGNFDCDQDVDGSDAAVFKQDFGRSPFFEPCDTCIDSPCPCTTACPNNYEPCVSNDDCDSGCCCNEADADRCHDQTYCESVLGSQCVSLPRDNGEPCTNGIECISGNCPSEDGVCCDTMCSDTCEACLASKTGGSDGICGPVIAGTDPDGECGGTEVCDGAGACVSP